MASNIPGFNNYEPMKISDIVNAKKDRSYAVKVVKTYPQIHEEISRLIKDDPRFKFLSALSNKKKTEEEYLINYKNYLDLVRDTIQKYGYGVYEKKEDGPSQMIPLEELARTLTSSFVGFDCLEDAKDDPEITDIYCLSWDCIYVEKAGHNRQYWKKFKSEQEYNNFIDRLLREDNKQLDTGEHKMVDAEIYGIRINVIHDTVASKGYCATFRKHADVPVTLEQMIGNDTMTERMAEMLKLFIRGALNACVAGVTGSGKTTLLKALFEGALGNGDPNYYVDEEMNRVITVEDTPELFLRVPHTVALHTYKTSDERTSISLRDLNLSALRMKPHYIVVGEIRGVEAASYIEAAATGHSSWASIHAGTVWSGIDRFVDKYGMSMPNLSSHAVERIIGTSVNFFIMIDNIPGIGRKVTAVHELIFNHATDQVEVKDIVRYEFDKGFVWHNTISEDSIDTMMRRGVKQSEINALQEFITEQIEIGKNL